MADISSDDQNEINMIIEDCHKKVKLAEILDWEIPSKITLYLTTHGELNLSQLASSLGKSKTTIKRHILPMLSTNIISERVYKKAHYYSLGDGWGILSIPILQYMQGKESRKLKFEQLVKQMTPEQLRVLNKASYAVYTIFIKMLRNTLDATLNYIDFYANMPASVNQALEIGNTMNLMARFTSLNEYNRPIFDKYWNEFLEKYVGEVNQLMDKKKESDPNHVVQASSDVAWHFRLPLNQLFKLK